MPYDPTPPKRRSYPTRTQFDVLVVFYKYHRRMARRRHRRPSLAELAIELGGMTKLGALHHVELLAQKGYLEQREISRHRSWELTPKGLKRAEQRWKLMEKWRKKYGC